jgi:Holliday junction resolvase
MPNHNYNRGRRFEYRIARLYREQGWFVFRSAGSHSPADLVCAKAGEIIAIQCQTDKYFAPAKVEQLVELARENNWRAMLYWTEKHKTQTKEIEFKEEVPACQEK